MSLFAFDSTLHSLLREHVTRGVERRHAPAERAVLGMDASENRMAAA
jgi:hypothetical protein